MPTSKPLAGADFINAKLGGANLLYATLSGTNLGERQSAGPIWASRPLAVSWPASSTAPQATTDNGVGLEYNALSGWNFANQNLANADFEHATLARTVFANAKLAAQDLSYAAMNGANFANADLHGAISPRPARQAQFANANLTGATFVPSYYYPTPVGSTLTSAHSETPISRPICNMPISLAPIYPGDYGVRLGHTTGLTLTQIYSTLSYHNGDLAGIGLEGNDLTARKYCKERWPMRISRTTRSPTPASQAPILAMPASLVRL